MCAVDGEIEGGGERGLGTWQSLSISGSLRPRKAVDI